MSNVDGLAILHILNNEKNAEKALDMVTPKMAAKGMLLHRNMLLGFCWQYKTEPAKCRWIIDELKRKGYVYNQKSKPSWTYIEYVAYPAVLHMILLESGLYKSGKMMADLYGRASRDQLDPFFDHGCIATKQDFGLRMNPRNWKYETFLTIPTAREKARKASIALIGAARVAGRGGEKDVMRVISRVVWSTRMSERWDESA